MIIRKFNESEIQDISTDRALEIIKEIGNILSEIEQKKEVIDSILNELNNFKSKSKNKNDQIDDSISNLELIRGYFDQSSDKLDNVIQNMKSYNQDGRKYLY